ncbi:sensor histidine kinase [Tissierella creatinophila]|uniref:histidine kinase n=1 Tax=Tissierella creatinophila DSM 6911 TaxID=1123403 RepID=A0A1U7M5E9_TISCR|nr:HAMP domain-containing sensor histidine kinase [Tissierella creatinophila]OLS02542.1 alkaline phosphatase synthesis sensor protein PhoR [Tissierella creatinophila DSM 6911]
MKKSIRKRLVKNFMLVILITVVIIEIFLSNSVKEYYYKNLEDVLTSQIESSTSFYSRYFPSFNLDDILIDDIDMFWRYTDVQVQILSLEGELLLDTLGISSKEPINTFDIVRAQNGEKGVWIGTVPYSPESVMAISVPLIKDDESIAIIRFVSSLEETNTIIQNIIIILIIIGLIVITIGGIVSIILANSIVNPLERVSNVAEKMANGQLKIRNDIENDDEIGRLASTLNHMADEIIKREQIKIDFISSVSHELRTPLTSIKGWSITLQTEDIEKDLLLDGLKIIEKESDRLSFMVEELLDFSKFISGRITLEKDTFDFSSTLNFIAKQYMPKSKNSNINFSVEIDENVNMIVGDENRIKQVLINLLDNAFKFTDEGGCVELKAYMKGDNLILEVEDTGIGISAEDLPKIKEKFYKGNTSRANSGIGLAICDEIVKLHEGELNIESQLGKGTDIKVILPYEEESI